MYYYLLIQQQIYYLLVHVCYRHCDVGYCMTIFDRYLHRFVIQFFNSHNLLDPCPPVKERYYGTACRIRISFASITSLYEKNVN